MSKLLLFSLLLLFNVSSSMVLAETIKPLLVDKGSLIFSDDFSAPSIDDHWSIKEKFRTAFLVNNSSLVGKELQGAGHGSTARTSIDVSDFVLEFDVKFDGSRQFNLVFDDLTDKTVHAGHVARVVFTKKTFSVQDDKTGIMNLVLKRQIKQHPQGKQAFKELLSSKKNKANYNFDNGKWHHIMVIKKGDILECRVGDKIAQLKSEGFSHPKLTQFGPTIIGNKIHFDNFRLWTIQPEL